jgi:hypothetical protein
MLLADGYVRLWGVALPVALGQFGPDGFTLTAMTGTGFVAAPGVFVSCAHCLPNDRGDLAAAVSDAEGVINLVPLTSITHDPLLDLATARIEYDPGYRFNFCPEEPWSGLDVWTTGFPLMTRERPTDGRGVWSVTPRSLRGYIVRPYDNDRHSGFAIQPSYELDMLSPAGLSGAPLMVHSLGPVGLRLLGVIYGTHDAYTIDAESLIDPETGEPAPEVRRYVSFGLAHQRESLQQLRGDATEGRRLDELLGTTP